MKGLKCTVALVVVSFFYSRTSPMSDAAPIKFIPYTGANTVVHGHLHNRLYLNGGVPFDLATDTLMLLNRLPGIGEPKDVSPNGRYLVSAANGTSSEHPNMSWVTVHDLLAGDSRDYYFQRELHEEGAYDAAFANDQTLLVTTTYRGSGRVPLRKIDLNTGVAMKIAEVEEDTALAASGDHSIVGFAEGNTTGGYFGYYNVSDGSVHKGGSVRGHIHQISANRDGSLLAIPSVRGVDVYDTSFHQLGRLQADYPNRYPVDVLFSPVSDVLYVSWTGHISIGIAPKSLLAYDSNSLSVLARLDETSHGDSREFLQLAVSNDGRRLFAVQSHNFDSGEGFNVYDVSRFGVPEPQAPAVQLIGIIGMAAMRRRCL